MAHGGTPYGSAGVHLGWFLAFAREQLPSDASWTTGDFCERVVKPATAADRCSYVSLLEQTRLPGGAPVVARPTHFVSHAWRYRLASLAGALSELTIEREWQAADETWSYDGARDDADAEPPIYIWLDVLCVNQHVHATEEFDWWSSTFRAAIARVGRTVSVLAPWEAPVATTRAWCVWELFCTVDSDTPLEIVLPPADRRRYVAALRAGDVASVRRALTSIDVEQAEAYKKEDRDMVLDHVAAAGGASQVNERVAAAILNATFTADKDGEGYRWTATPLCFAAEKSPAGATLVAKLIALGADPKRPSEGGETPLHTAVLHGRCDCARVLIEKGADLSAKMTSGWARGRIPLKMAFPDPTAPPEKRKRREGQPEVAGQVLRAMRKQGFHADADPEVSQQVQEVENWLQEAAQQPREPFLTSIYAAVSASRRHVWLAAVSAFVWLSRALLDWLAAEFVCGEEPSRLEKLLPDGAQRFVRYTCKEKFA